MLQFDSLHIHSHARIDVLLAEAEGDRLAALAAGAADRAPRRAARSAGHGPRLHPRAWLAAGLYALAVWLDPSLALAFGVRPGAASHLGLPR